MPNSKKFFDIIPPKTSKDRISPFLVLKKESFQEKETKDLKIIHKSHISDKPSFKKRDFLNFWQLPQRITVLFLFFLLGGGLFCHFVLAKTEIAIWPETEIVSFVKTVTVDINSSQVDVQRKVIPGRIFEVEKATSQEFPTSGKLKKEEKAKGVIKVYNNYSTVSQDLVANTRFISDDGKLFRSLESVVIPGGEYEKSSVLGSQKLVPGYLDVKVVAAQPGPDYNIGPSTFSIPGFAGTPKYTAFYGKSFSPMEGGFVGETLYLSEEDLEKAEKIVTERAENEGKDLLKSKVPEGFVLIQESISYPGLENYSLSKAGAEIDVFTFQVKAKTKGMGFKTDDLEQFSQEFINLNIPETKKIQRESLKTNYALQSINSLEGRAIIDLEFGAKVFADLDLSSLKRAILGKSLKEAQILLRDHPQIVEVVAKTFPFWLKNIPQGEEHVKIELIVE